MSDPDPKIPKPGFLDSLTGAFNRLATRIDHQARQPDSLLNLLASHAASQGDQFDGSHGFARHDSTPLASSSVAPVAAPASRHAMPWTIPSALPRFDNPFDSLPMEPIEPTSHTAQPGRSAAGMPRASMSANDLTPGSTIDPSLFTAQDLRAGSRHDSMQASSSAPPPPPRAASLDPLAAAAIMRDGYADRSDADLGGWKRVTDVELREQNLDPKQFHDTASGMRADLYRKDDQFVLNFRGTDKAGDWPHNLSQAAGLGSVQYDDAVKLTRQVNQALPDGLHAVVGHSKGGGQAYLAAQACDIECVVANPAWPNEQTLRQHHIEPSQLSSGPPTTELVVKGEPLNSLQRFSSDSLGIGSLHRPHGVKIELDGPAFAPRPHPTLNHHVRGLDPDFDQAEAIMRGFDRGNHQLVQHGMATVFDATGTRRASELAELARSGGISRVDHFVAAGGVGGASGGGFMVQGDVNNPASPRVKFSGEVPAQGMVEDMTGRVNRQIIIANATAAVAMPSLSPAPTDPTPSRNGGPSHGV